MPALRNPNYQTSLEKLNIFNLETKNLRDQIIEVFKNFKKKCSLHYFVLQLRGIIISIILSSYVNSLLGRNQINQESHFVTIRYFHVT